MPYTSHGHWFGPGEPTQPGPSLRAKCMQFTGCAVCRREAGMPPPSWERQESTPYPDRGAAEKVRILDGMTPGEKHVALKFIIGHSPAVFDQAALTIRWLREGYPEVLADSSEEG